MESHGIDKLRQAILHDAHEVARGQIRQAEASAAIEQEKARRGAEGERLRIVRDAEREANSLRRQIGSKAELEACRRLLEARERLIRQVLDQALTRLKEENRIEVRRMSLLRLVVDAAREMGGGQLLVRTSSTDARLVDAEFLAEASHLLASEGISANLEAAEHPAEIVGGAIVSRNDGRLAVDNSFEARLRRQRAGLRSGIWRILSGKE
jgi:V/A-type H+/Na+-transporting ATPase subunit E